MNKDGKKWRFVRMPDGGILISFDEYENRHQIADGIEKEIESALKLQEIFEYDLRNWKASSEMKSECGYAMMSQKFVEDVYSILKNMKEKSEK